MPWRTGDGVIFGLPFIRLAAGPESILPVVVMDSGLARSLSSGGAERRPVGAPRHDGGGGYGPRAR
jgi:hypothetical protein